MLVGLSGPTLTLSPGDEHTFPDDEALRFIQAGFAVAAQSDDVETTEAVLPLGIETRRRKKA